MQFIILNRLLINFELLSQYRTCIVGFFIIVEKLCKIIITSLYYLFNNTGKIWYLFILYIKILSISLIMDISKTCGQSKNFWIIDAYQLLYYFKIIEIVGWLSFS